MYVQICALFTPYSCIEICICIYIVLERERDYKEQNLQRCMALFMTAE